MKSTPLCLQLTEPSKHIRWNVNSPWAVLKRLGRFVWGIFMVDVRMESHVKKQYVFDFKSGVFIEDMSNYQQIGVQISISDNK